MAVYKVAQDVEAEDKILGPFTFRQFIYLIIVAIAIALAWGLSQLFIPLAIIPLPVIIFFGALALPLRKDQPMEVYLAALVSFYTKPRKRLWIPDGLQSLIEITVPNVAEIDRTKNLSQTEAERRLAYLASIADSQGWAVRHSEVPAAQNAMISDVYYEAQQTEDMLDTNNTVARTFDTKISQADAQRRQAMINQMHAPQSLPVQTQQFTQTQPQMPAYNDPYASLQPPQTPIAPAQSEPSESVHIQYNPYPTIHQSVIKPLSEQKTPETQTTPSQSPTQTTSATTVSPGIINLANNSDLSIETIAREAHRMEEKAKDDDQEVVISLR